jgi:hypothetical protein
MFAIAVQARSQPPGEYETVDWLFIEGKKRGEMDTTFQNRERPGRPHYMLEQSSTIPQMKRKELSLFSVRSDA